MSRTRADQHPRRREQFEPRPQQRRRLGRSATFVVAGLALLGAFAYALSGRRAEPLRHERVAAEAGGAVRLNAAQFDDGQARFFQYATADGRELRFFVLKSADGVMRAAFDTCDVCYRKRKGYRQTGDLMICNNCGKAFRSVDINVLQGGCNPVPLDRVVQNGQVVLTTAALQAGAVYF